MGPKLQLSLEEQPLSSDTIFEEDGIKVLIHQNDFVYFEQTELDYEKGGGFLLKKSGLAGRTDR
ncbi:hypothetical protein [Mesobacillus zeae]|uniref:Uncharacterized protein n=1 Tax=Mesobacillus zeae TaxID=1917180 RepID=A0A398B6Q4_9BACI|nr:hypothetical protein [Mesobacillus zeae]RID85789.1 hypothetical protein D1970_09660 [Mesobacillus zeae]